MWTIIVTELTQALAAILRRKLAHYLPRVIVMLSFIALLGLLIAYLLKVGVRAVLRWSKIFQALRAYGRDTTTEPGGAAVIDRAIKPVRLLGRLGWIRSVGRQCPWDRRSPGIYGPVFPFLPRLFAALVILFLGLLAASFFSLLAQLCSRQ